jgi:hypothetical protein
VRRRLVTEQGSARHVSSVLLTEDEAEWALAHEAVLHRATGWDVCEHDGAVVALRGDVKRMITIRESGPMDDEL